jgi:hypothetical protein
LGESCPAEDSLDHIPTPGSSSQLSKLAIDRRVTLHAQFDGRDQLTPGDLPALEKSNRLRHFACLGCSPDAGADLPLADEICIFVSLPFSSSALFSFPSPGNGILLLMMSSSDDGHDQFSFQFCQRFTPDDQEFLKGASDLQPPIHFR